MLMAKRSKAKAKAKYGKSAKKKTAKKKTAKKKTTKKKTTKKKTAKKKSGRIGPPVDPCQTEEDALALADEAVNDISKELDNPDLSADHRRRLEQALIRAQGRRS